MNQQANAFGNIKFLSRDFEDLQAGFIILIKLSVCQGVCSSAGYGQGKLSHITAHIAHLHS